MSQKFLLFLFSLFILNSCKENIKYDCIDEQVEEKIKFSEIQDIFNANCISCHNTLSKDYYAGLDLSQNTYANIVNAFSTERTNEFLVKEFSPDSSYLYRKLTGENIELDKMPLSGSLNQININKIKLWIEQGAKNE